MDLEFERPILELERKIEALKQARGSDLKLSQEIEKLEAKASTLVEQTFAKLTPWQKVQLSRHPNRPYTLDYLERMIEDFVELHGDRAYADDHALVGGLGYFDRRPMMVIGHQKGRNTKESLHRNFGMARPEGYRKAKRLMELAARFGIPILTLIDTMGAYPGLGAEERGQAEAIAKNLEVMIGLPVPVIAVVIGEGGSGGALALGVADRILMMQYAMYSVISPEGCASILWRDAGRAEQAARALKVSAQEIHELRVADEVIAEPPGGAHRDWDGAARAVIAAVRRHLGQLRGLSTEELLEKRYQKYRQMGAFLER